jgi:HEPN domain-containing protein
MSDRDAEMSKVVRAWLDVADKDVASARVLRDAGGLTRAVCFHAQQAVEKYLKALLVVNGTQFGKTHDIADLLELLPGGHRPEITSDAASRLTQAAVADRYPEASAPSDEEARRLVDVAEQVRAFVRQLVPSDVREP